VVCHPPSVRLLLAVDQRPSPLAAHPPAAYETGMTMPKEFLVALDGLPESSRALSVAAALAAQLDTHVSAVCVNSPNADWGVDEADMKRQAEDAGVALWRSVTVGSEDVAPALLRTVAESPAALLCVGSHGRGPLGQAILGSVNAEVLACSTQPVLVVGPQAIPSKGFRSVVVCLDGSSVALTAMQPAVEWARTLRATVRAVTVLPPQHVFPRDQFPADVDVRYDSDTATAVTEFVREVDAGLIVATSHGLSGLAAIGGTAASLVRHAPCPLLLIGPHAAREVRR